VINIKASDSAGMKPREFRDLVRSEKWTSNTESACCGYVQANLVIVPEDVAFEFLMFCIRNPKPCPILEVGDAGSPYTKLVADRADIRTDLPGYQVIVNGELADTPNNIKDYWKDDYIFFLLGCSLSFDWLLREAGIQYRFIGAYKSNIEAVPAGRFAGHYVVTCRLFKSSYEAIRAIEISAKYPRVHGAPVHLGNPSAIGISDLTQLFHHRPTITSEPMKQDEIPLFWACGVTPQSIAKEVRLPLMISHGVGRLFITDWLTKDLT
jgi:uncharacterized protein YcsI (UPF0317 family)